jgi:tetratricopeptide (TPR) repeat protein
LQRYETKIDSIQETQFHLLRTSLITLAALITLGLGGYLLIKKGQDAATVRDQVAAEKQKLLSAQINILIQDRAAIQKERDPDLPAITEEELLQQLAIRRNKPVDYIRTTLAAAIESSDNLLQAQGFLLAGKGKQAEDKADSVLAAEAFATQRIRQAYEVKAQVASNESRYQDALKNFQTAAALCDQTTEPLLWANVQNKIARALMLLDDFENAQNVAIDTIKYLEVKNFTDERIYADCLSNLGSITEGTSRFDEAEKYKKMAVEHGRSSYGENHPEYVNFLSNLGVYYLKREEFNDAKDLLLRSLEYNEASFGKESTVIISDLNNLGQFYQKTKNYRESEDLMNRCLGLIKSKLGINHVIYGATLGNLGTLYVEMNRLPEAERNLKNAITVLENKLGENHSLVAAGWGNLAIVFKQNKQYGDAESSLKKSIEIDERIFGANHPNLVVRYFNLSSIYAEIGQLNDAEDFARKSLILTMKFGYGTGKKKEGFNEIIEQYLKILLSRGLSFEDITSRVISIGPEAGWDAATWAKSMEPILQFVASQKK